MAASDPPVNATVERNKSTVRRMLERLSAGDVAGFTDHLAAGYRRHSHMGTAGT